MIRFPLPCRPRSLPRHAMLALAATSLALGSGCLSSAQPGQTLPRDDAKNARAAGTAAASSAAASGSSATTVRTYVRLRVPLFNDAFSSTPLAMVDGEPITVGDVVGVIASSGGHGGADDGQMPSGSGHAPHKGGKAVAKGSSTKVYHEVLQRLIDTRLLLAEARATELDALPEAKRALDRKRLGIARRIVEADATKDLKLDDAKVERLFREMVKEWKVRSVLAKSLATAKAIRARVTAGESFDATIKKPLAAKEATGGDKAVFMSMKTNLLPPIRNALRPLKVGDVSKPVQVPTGWVVMHVEEMRYPEDAEARAQARRRIFVWQRKKALDEFYERRIKALAKINKRLLARLDLGAKKPGYAALLKDKRILARVDGQDPITVAALAEFIQRKFFHGVAPAIRDKRINPQKIPSLRAMLRKRVAEKHAQELGVTSRDDYKHELKEATIAVLVGLFIQKMISNGLTITDREGKEYLRAHVADYTYPEFYMFSSLGFRSKQAAAKALAALERGTDLKWLQAHADGLADGDDRTMATDGMTLSARSLEPALAKALAGARVGNYRLYASPRGFHYVVRVDAHTPSKTQPYKEVREQVVKKATAEKLNRTVKMWTKKLRKAYRVHVYAEELATETRP